MIAEDIKINSFVMQSDEEEVEEKGIGGEEVEEGDDDLFGIPEDDDTLDEDKEGDDDEGNLVE